MVNLPLNLRSELPRTRSEIFVSRSAIQCHRVRSHGDSDSFGVMDGLEPGSLLKGLESYLVQIDIKLSPDDKVSGEVSKIRNYEQFALSTPNISLSLKFVEMDYKMMKEVFEDPNRYKANVKRANPKLTDKEIEEGCQREIKSLNEAKAIFDKFIASIQGKNPEEINSSIDSFLKEEDRFSLLRNRLQEARLQGKDILTDERLLKDFKEYNTLLKLIGLMKSLQRYYKSQFDNYYDPFLPAFMDQRARYEISRDPSVFNDFLPYRNFIKGNKKRLDNYERLVKKIQDGTGEKFKFGEKENPNDPFDTRFKTLKNPTSSLKYLMAASVVELLHNREDLVDLVLGYNSGLNIRFYSGASGGVEGIYRGDLHTLYVNTLPYLVSLANKSKTNCTARHELIHALDQSDGICDGFLPHLNKDEKKNFEGIESRYPIKYMNRKEFLAWTLDLFCSDPNQLSKNSKELYNFYMTYFRYDPLLER